jgi:hypothetical protein
VARAADTPGRRLALLATLKWIAGTYRAIFGFLVVTSLIVFTPLALVDAVAHAAEHIDFDQLTDAEFFAVLTGVLLLVVTSTLGEQFYAGLVGAGVLAHRTGERHSIGHVARTLPYGRLFLADLVFSAGTAIGFVLLLVPGVLFFTWFVLTAPVIKIERRGVRAAFARSRALVRGHFWLVLAVLGPPALASAALASLVQSDVMWLGDTLTAGWVRTLLVLMLFQPLQAVAAFVLTWELIELKADA